MRFNHEVGKIQLAACLLAVVVVVSSCANTKAVHRWTDAVLETQKRHASGELDDAKSAFRALHETAPDDERRRWIETILGGLHAESGERDAALDWYEEAYADDDAAQYGARAMYAAARLVEPDDPERARAMKRQTIERFPDWMGAEYALADLVEHHRATGEHEALLQLLDELHSEVEETEIADRILYEIATLYRDVLDRPDDALDAYRTLYRTYPTAPLADEALWEMAAIYRDHQQWEPALRVLEILATDTETSWFVGTYNSQWVDDAMFQMGMINLLHLDDYDEAVEWFETYVDHYPGTTRTDDAAWNIVEARRLQGDDDAHLNALRRFVDAHPESRHAERAHARLGTGR